MHHNPARVLGVEFSVIAADRLGLPGEQRLHR
jgi:hypothetical protein